MAVSLRAGGRDLADDAKASPASVLQREYHHLFPDAVLTGAGGLPSSHSFRAVNCALVTWRTNRKISAKQPLQYLRDRAKASNLGEAAIRERLRSHLIPFDELASAGGWLADEGDVQMAIQQDYATFTRARALMLMGPIHDLCNNGTAPVEHWLTDAASHERRG